MENTGMISAVVLTFNEERNIERCLHSLLGIADEIIVIDSFSKDNTEAICARFSVNFIQRIWEGYSSAKNYGNSLAKYDYILSIDADEVLSDELKKSILSEKEHFSSEAYWMPRLTNYCGQWIHHSGWYPDAKIRLWAKGKAEWVGIIHEELRLNNCKAGKLKGDLYHYSYYSISDHLSKINAYSSLMAEAKLKKGKNPSIFKIIMSPIFKFVKSYFFQLGFLDGYYGFFICILSSYVNLLKYAKTRELFKERNAVASKVTRSKIVYPIFSEEKTILQAKKAN